MKYNASRFEIKYLVPASVRVAFIQDIRAKCERDAFAISPLASYRIRSLYLESRERDCYFEKLDGLEYRRKFRIREYPGSGPVRNFEIKERYSNRISKRKCNLSPSQYRSIVSGVGTMIYPRNAVLDEFSMYRTRNFLIPTLITDYKRVALSGRSDTRLRITFDSDLRVAASRCLDSPTNVFHSVLPRGIDVLEIKFNDVLPEWIHTLIAKYALQDLSVSKFVLGLDVLVERGHFHDE